MPPSYLPFPPRVLALRLPCPRTLPCSMDQSIAAARARQHRAAGSSSSSSGASAGGETLAERAGTLLASSPASGRNFVAALFSGSLATLATQPADLLKTHQQLTVSEQAGRPVPRCARATAEPTDSRHRRRAPRIVESAQWQSRKPPSLQAVASQVVASQAQAHR